MKVALESSHITRPGSTLRRCAPPPDGLRNALRAKNATAAAAGGVRLIEDKKMDLIGGLKTEVFRPVIMLMVPGLVVGVPTLFVLQHYQPGLFDFIESHPTLSTFIGFIAATILGVLTYEFGTNIEAKIIDKCIEKRVKRMISMQPLSMIGIYFFDALFLSGRSRRNI
ncbi:hypothetical protein ACFQH7_17155 [Microbulbifer taiwanensis]